jgi:hypothetical protein
MAENTTEMTEEFWAVLYSLGAKAFILRCIERAREKRAAMTVIRIGLMSLAEVKMNEAPVLSFDGYVRQLTSETGCRFEIGNESVQFVYEHPRYFDLPTLNPNKLI